MKLSRTTAKASDKDELFGSLIEMLSDEVTLYEHLGEILGEKQQAIIAGDVDRLRECVLEEQSLVQKALSAADRRNSYVVNLSRAEKTKEREPRLETIINIAPAIHSVKLEHLRNRLRTQLDQITRTNRENRYLLNSSIEHVKGLVHIFLQVDEQSSQVYDIDGIINSSQERNRVLDCQI